MRWPGSCHSRRTLPADQFLSPPATPAPRTEDGLVNVPITAIPELVEFAQKESVAFTVVGPEAPLAEGIVDAFRAAGLKIFGPTKQAAQLETSKDFAKAFMQRHGIPTAAYATFTSAAEAHRYVDEKGAPIVIKADGLAAGKGVVVATTAEEAHAAIDTMLVTTPAWARPVRASSSKSFSKAKKPASSSWSTATMCLPLATSQDHKRLRTGDQGPNTGGMGAYSPAPVSRRPCTRGSCARSSIRRSTAWRRKATLHRFSLCRPDDYRRWRHQGAGVQLPHGRPRNRSHPVAPEKRSRHALGARR